MIHSATISIKMIQLFHVSKVDFLPCQMESCFEVKFLQVKIKLFEFPVLFVKTFDTFLAKYVINLILLNLLHFLESKICCILWYPTFQCLNLIGKEQVLLASFLVQFA